MVFKNKKELLTVPNKKSREDILKVFESGIKAVNPYISTKKMIKIKGDKLILDSDIYQLNSFENIYVIGAGKASIQMVRAIFEIFGNRISGYVNSLENKEIGNIICNKSCHPIPDKNGEIGATNIYEIAKNAGKNDLIICLISGGGSAMMPLPENGISLKDKIEVTKLLLECGANINEINAVRKHLSKIKGGKLANIAYPAKTISLILSDVVGDPLDSIASGPTSPDSTTYEDVLQILKKYDIYEKIPKNVIYHIISKKNETPKPGDKIFENVKNIIIANNKIALNEASKKSVQLGYNTMVLTSHLEGEAREVGIMLTGIAKDILKYDEPVKKPAMILCGGETTVNLTGNGKGGRNQELVISALRKLPENVTIASIGTDGIDGNSNSAGAIGDFDVLKISKEKELNIDEFLKNNDSNTFFKKTNGLINTGPTGTNVADIIAVVIK